MLTNKLQQLRWDKGWTQRQLEKHSGINHSLICRIENEDRPNPTITTVLQLAKALEVPVEKIFSMGEFNSEKKEDQDLDVEHLLKRIRELEEENKLLKKIINLKNKTISRLLDHFILKP